MRAVLWIALTARIAFAETELDEVVDDREPSVLEVAGGVAISVPRGRGVSTMFSLIRLGERLGFELGWGPRESTELTHDTFYRIGLNADWEREVGPHVYGLRISSGLLIYRSTRVESPDEGETGGAFYTTPMIWGVRRLGGVAVGLELAAPMYWGPRPDIDLRAGTYGMELELRAVVQLR